MAAFIGGLLEQIFFGSADANAHDIIALEFARFGGSGHGFKVWRLEGQGRCKLSLARRLVTQKSRRVFVATSHVLHLKSAYIFMRFCQEQNDKKRCDCKVLNERYATIKHAVKPYSMLSDFVDTTTDENSLTACFSLSCFCGYKNASFITNVKKEKARSKPSGDNTGNVRVKTRWQDRVKKRSGFVGCV